MVALRRHAEPASPEKAERRELYREQCRDDTGVRYTVIVFRPFPNLRQTDYVLEDGTPVRFIDDCLFEIPSTGTILTRCGQ